MNFHYDSFSFSKIINQILSYVDSLLESDKNIEKKTQNTWVEFRNFLRNNITSPWLFENFITNQINFQKDQLSFIQKLSSQDSYAETSASPIRKQQIYSQSSKINNKIINSKETSNFHINLPYKSSNVQFKNKSLLDEGISKKFEPCKTEQNFYSEKSKLVVNVCENYSTIKPNTFRTDSNAINIFPIKNSSKTQSNFFSKFETEVNNINDEKPNCLFNKQNNFNKNNRNEKTNNKNFNTCIYFHTQDFNEKSPSNHISNLQNSKKIEKNIEFVDSISQPPLFHSPLKNGLTMQKNRIFEEESENQSPALITFKNNEFIKGKTTKNYEHNPNINNNLKYRESQLKKFAKVRNFIKVNIYFKLGEIPIFQPN